MCKYYVRIYIAGQSGQGSYIVESSPARTCQRSRLKRAGGGGTARPPVWGTYGTDLGLTYTQEHRGGGFKEGPRDSGTQYAQRTGETVSGMKTTAGDSERGHKGRAACLHSFGGAAYRQEFVFELSTTSAH
ncbi:hypothetical protein DPMN_018011 [Dreissena polymorpha]|uniref:Uncharacterized protein n=1 Tax=Dreissena polymorpha TaxID=45954 RepID=A0A9D4NHL9_DREPO|nr:hypothetical protein DPMN_018011 [Dreissena polymorpha]